MVSLELGLTICEPIEHTPPAEKRSFGEYLINLVGARKEAGSRSLQSDCFIDPRRAASAFAIVGWLIFFCFQSRSHMKFALARRSRVSACSLLLVPKSWWFFEALWLFESSPLFGNRLCVYNNRASSPANLICPKVFLKEFNWISNLFFRIQFNRSTIAGSLMS